MLLATAPRKKSIAAKAQRGNFGQMQGRRNRLFEMDNEKKITGWRMKIEDRQVWNRIVKQTKTHPEL